MTRSWSSDGALVDRRRVRTRSRSSGGRVAPVVRRVPAAGRSGDRRRAGRRSRGAGRDVGGAPRARAGRGARRSRAARASGSPTCSPTSWSGAAELLVSKATGATIGVHRQRYLLVQPRGGGSARRSSSARGCARCSPPTWGSTAACRCGRRAETPYFRSGDAVLPPVMIKTLFGEFAARPSPDVRATWTSIPPGCARTSSPSTFRCSAGLVQPRARPPAPRRDVVARTPWPRPAHQSYAGCFAPKFVNRDPTAMLSTTRGASRSTATSRGTRTGSRRIRIRASSERWSASASSGAARSSSPTATTSSIAVRRRPFRRLTVHAARPGIALPSDRANPYPDKLRARRLA